MQRMKGWLEDGEDHGNHSILTGSSTTTHQNLLNLSKSQYCHQKRVTPRNHITPTLRRYLFSLCLCSSPSSLQRVTDGVQRVHQWFLIQTQWCYSSGSIALFMCWSPAGPWQRASWGYGREGCSDCSIPGSALLHLGGSATRKTVCSFFRTLPLCLAFISLARTAKKLLFSWRPEPTE